MGFDVRSSHSGPALCSVSVVNYDLILKYVYDLTSLWSTTNGALECFAIVSYIEHEIEFIS